MTKAERGRDSKPIDGVDDAPETEAGDEPTAAQSAPDQEAGEAAEGRVAALEAFDLDGDGTISNTEAVRANLGVVDANLQALAKRGGILGALAAALHRVVDRFDND